MAEPLSLFGPTAVPPAIAPAAPRQPEQHQPEPKRLAVIPAKQLRTRMAAAGWPLEQQARLFAELDACRRIRTEDGRGCPRYPVDVTECYAVLVEPAWEYDPKAKGPRAQPIERGHVQRFWRGDVERPWVFTQDKLTAAIQRDNQDRSAVLMPDGVTVLAPDDDLGFTVSLEDWLAAGGTPPASTQSPRSSS